MDFHYSICSSERSLAKFISITARTRRERSRCPCKKSSMQTSLSHWKSSCNLQQSHKTAQLSVVVAKSSIFLDRADIFRFFVFSFCCWWAEQFFFRRKRYSFYAVGILTMTVGESTAVSRENIRSSTLVNIENILHILDFKFHKKKKKSYAL